MTVVDMWKPPHPATYYNSECWNGKKKCHFFTKPWNGFLYYFSPKEMWSFPPIAGPLFRAGTQVRIRLLSPRAFSESGQSSTASSCRITGAELTPGVTDCQPGRHRAITCTALLQTLLLSTWNCQEGFLLTGKHGFTFSVLRFKSMRQLETRVSCTQSRTSQSISRQDMLPSL